MKTLLAVAIAFFVAFGGLVVYFASGSPGHEYDLNYVLPIDARTMPRVPPAVVRGEEPVRGGAASDEPTVKSPE